uniref:Uncharacterized protein n=1 Tax=Myotis myotis TaxID=51298 RepID=A0A7J7XZH3_MYOMY|nr:hypothetical protein mMyoMyo1_011352 [Myotis myotis]
MGLAGETQAPLSVLLTATPVCPPVSECPLHLHTHLPLYIHLHLNPHMQIHTCAHTCSSTHSCTYTFTCMTTFPCTHTCPLHLTCALTPHLHSQVGLLCTSSGFSKQEVTLSGKHLVSANRCREPPDLPLHSRMFVIEVLVHIFST